MDTTTTSDTVYRQIVRHLDEIDMLAIDGKLQMSPAKYDAIRSILRKVRVLTAQMDTQR